MSTNEEIVFDSGCGISEEEQREIFAQINSIAEKNRLSLSIAADSGAGKEKRHFKAKKSGGVFPVLVNVAAIAALAGGFLALYAFQGKTDAQVREGARVYNSAERALIEELVSEQSAAARGELEQLSREQIQTAAVEAQMAAFFANLSRAVNESNLEEAVRIIRSMRDFLNTPAFQGLRSIQSRKDLYAQAINSFEIIVNELRRTQAALASGIMSLDRSAEAMFLELQEKNAQLERDLAEMDRALRASNTAGASATQNLTALEGRFTTLQTQNNALQDRFTNLQTQNGTLQTDLNRANQRVQSLESNVNRQEAVITNRNDCIEQIQQVIRGKAIADMTISELSDNLSRIQRALQTLN